MKIIKDNRAVILAFIIGLVLSGGVVYALTIAASEINYDNSISKLKDKYGNDVVDAETAIDTLYEEAEELLSCESVARPNLGNKLIPVTITNDDNAKVTYVSSTSSSWYNYCDKNWANAILLIDNPSKTYNVGDTINEADIESYFVWIPKYRYKLWNTGTASKNAHEIEIIFDTTNTTNINGYSCATPMTSGNIGSCNNGEWMTHPAFISMNVDGFWVGKFETGYMGATTKDEAQVNGNDSSKIIIKPNVYAWRNNTIYNFFTASYNYERDLNSHMMKNTEWGAVAYLSHSRFGKNTEVNINNNNAFITGKSALPSTNQQTYPGTYGNSDAYNASYNTSIGHLASTTGNITGVYDMSGGAHEYMASYQDTYYGDSGFTSSNIGGFDSKYFDVYNESSSTKTYNYMILGDATGEMGPFKSFVDGDNTDAHLHNSWYGDLSHFVSPSYPWIYRGGNYDFGVLTGQFSIRGHTGAAYSKRASRLVLAP